MTANVYRALTTGLLPSTLSPQQSCGVGTTLIPIRQVKKLRHQDVKLSAQVTQEVAELAFKKSHADPRNFVLNHLTILTFSKDRNAKGSIVFHFLFCSAGQGTQFLGCSDSQQRRTHPQPLKPCNFGEWGI